MFDRGWLASLRDGGRRLNPAGRPAAFILACTVIAVWGATGPVFRYSDTWQLIINTGTTIVTFLMVFLMQNTQNRDTISIQLKLDELIRANENARNAMLSLEDLTEDQLARIKATFDRIGARTFVVSDDARSLSAVDDSTGDLAAWFAAHDAAAVLLRPDFYVYGAAADSFELNRLVSGLTRAF